jgi:membrane protease YdiL (CAAX protease family)
MRQNLIRKYPLASFFILALMLGAGFVVLVGEGVLPSGLALASVLSASISGVLMTAVEDRRAGLRRLFIRLLIWRVGIRYWLFSLLFPIPVFLLGSLFNPVFDGEPITIRNLESPFGILPMFIGFFIVAGLGQELGWTGFLLARLQSRYSALISSIIRGVLVGTWHLPLLVYSRFQNPAFGDFPYAGWIAQKGFLIAFTVMVLMFSVPWSIFYTWIFNNTGGSLLLVAALHGSEIWVAYLMMRGGIDPSSLNNYWGYGTVMLLISIILVIMSGSQDLSHKRERIVDQPASVMQIQRGT